MIKKMVCGGHKEGIMKKLRVGIIGLGNIFIMHAKSVLDIENAELVAICDIKEDRAKRHSKEIGCKYYLDYKEMLEKENLDVVHICTPHYLHSCMTVDALNMGINVLTEKPMSINYEDAKDMLDASKKTGKTLGVIFQNRYNAGSKLIKDTLKSGELGKVLSARSMVTWDRSDEYYQGSDWKGTWDKEGGGVLIDQAIHTLDLMRWFIDSDIDYIDANISNRAHKIIEVEDSSEGVVKFKSGVFGSFFVINYHTYDAPTEIELHCEKGMVKMISDTAYIKFNDGREYIANPNPTEMFNYGDVKQYWGVSHIKQIEDFYNALLNGEKMLMSAEEALETQKMINAIYDSGKQNKRIIF